MQQEDDLRALAKIMDFLRAVSIILVVIHVYWYGYGAIRIWGLGIGVVDRILINFQRTAGLFSSMLYTKLFAVVLLGLSCLGTKGVKGEKITWEKIYAALGIQISKRIRLRHLTRIHLLLLGERLTHDAVGHIELIRRHLGFAVGVDKTVLCSVGTSAESGFVILYLTQAFLHFLASRQNPYDNI